MHITSGNLTNETNKYPDKRGWFVGQFIDTSSLLHSKNLEIKWGLHKAGEIFDTIRMNKHAKSLSILIDGEFKFIFPDTNKTYHLKQKGDFIFWDAGVFHSTECKKDSTILTIRWPSIDNDVETKIKKILQ
jgi:hypothetical protein